MLAAESRAPEENATPTTPTTPPMVKEEDSDSARLRPRLGPLRMSLAQFSRLARDDRVYARLLNLYAFGRDIWSNPFKLAILNRMEHFYVMRTIPGRDGKLPALDVVRHAVNVIGMDSEASRRLASWYAKRGECKMKDEAALASLPPEFLAEVVKSLFERVRNTKKGSE